MDLKENIRLTSQQLETLEQSMPINRFWKIKELDGIGSTTYKNLFNYCKKQITGERYEQLNLFD